MCTPVTQIKYLSLGGLFALLCYSYTNLSASLSTSPSDLQQELQSLIAAKIVFLQKHDSLNLFPRMSQVASQLCTETSTEKQATLERELSILAQLYLKQLQPMLVDQLKKIACSCREVATNLQKSGLGSQPEGRQKHFVELLFM